MANKTDFSEALRQGLDQSMERDERVYLIGLGVPDPMGIWGSTKGLQEKYGEDRVMDMPTSENAMTGVALGSTMKGLRPVMTHQRVDFALYAMEQIVNQAAKWHSMFGGKHDVPLVIRMAIGRGWGQGPQHSQSLQAWFAHVPGLKVVMPSNPRDAKGLLISSIEDDNPVIFLEHRWLYNTESEVPEEYFRTHLGEPNVLRTGSDVTLVTMSHMTVEALRAHKFLKKRDISVEIIDLRTLRPLGDDVIFQSVQKTNNLVVADTGWKTGGFSSEVVSRVVENPEVNLDNSPKRLALKDAPIPTSPPLANQCYPRAEHLVETIRDVLNRSFELPEDPYLSSEPLDVPNEDFTGPF